MQQKTPKQNNVLENIIDFALKNQLLLAIVSGGIVFLIFIGILFNYIVTSNNDKANRIYDVAINYLNNMDYFTNASDRAKIYQEQINNLNAVVQLYPNTVTAVRSRILLGKVFFQEAYQTGKEESINLAISYYDGAYAISKSKFYKALALIGRGQCFEQKNDFTKAYDDYNQIVTLYSGEGFTPLAYIGMARSKEMMQDIKAATDIYQKVADEFTNSQWARFAMGKIFYFSEAPARKVNNPAVAPGTNQIMTLTN